MSKRVGFSLLIMAVVLVFAVGSKTACAVPISQASTIHIGGGLASATGGGVDQDGSRWDIATGIDFDNTPLNRSFVGGRTGDFLTVGPFTSVNFESFMFDPILIPSPVTLWQTVPSFFYPVPTLASFVMDEVYVSVQTVSTLTLRGTGTLALEGFDDTAGSWVLTLQGMNGSFSYSTTSAPVPEPGTIALLGIGLAGLVGVGVRRRAKKNAV